MQVITFVFTEQHMIASEWCQSCFKIASPAVDSALKSSVPVWILKGNTIYCQTKQNKICGVSHAKL